jgi:hypothetical protein
LLWKDDKSLLLFSGVLMVVLDSTNDQMLAMDMLAFDKMKGNRRKQSKPIRVSNSADSKFKQWRFTSTNTCINKMNNHHSPQIIEHNKKDYNI